MRNRGDLEKRHRLGQLAERLRAEIIGGIRERGGSVERSATRGLLIVNQEFTMSLQVVECRPSSRGSYGWRMTTVPPEADIALTVRLDAANNSPLDYYLLPAKAIPVKKLLLKEENGLAIDTFRFDSLEFLLGMGQRTKLMETL